MQYEVTFEDPRSLVDYELNAKKHPPEQIESLAKQIKEVGFRNPIVVDKDNVICQGHGRKAAAILAGLDSVPVHRLPADFDPARIRAMRLFDNKIADTGIDEKLLRQELSELVSLDGFEFSWTGFAESEIVDVLPEDNDWAKERGERKAEENERADAVPELAEQNPRGVVRGQVWKLGRHRLMCGDSTSAVDLARLMNDQQAQISFTSPPYNAGRAPLQSERETKGIQHDKYRDYRDDKAQADWLELVSSALTLAMTNSEYQFFNVQHLAGNKIALIEWLHKFRLHIVDTAIWDKGHAVPQMADKVMGSQFEYVYIFCKKENPSKAVPFAQFSRGFSNCYSAPRQLQNEFSRVHAATFPVHLPEFFVSNFSHPNGTVLDIFGGTGTTLIACEKTGRTCFMSEIDPHYCSVIIQRFEDFTGQKAELLTSP